MRDDFMYYRYLIVILILGFGLSAQAQPTAVSINPSFNVISVGQAVLLTSSTSGTGPFSYQWNKDGTAIPGATSSSIQITGDAAYVNQGSYTLTVSNGSSLTSTGSQVSVKRPAPVITTQPQSQSVSLNGTATFSIGISGYDPATVEIFWFSGTSPTPSNPVQVGNGPSLNLAVTSPLKAGNYFVRVGGSVTGPPNSFIYTEYAYSSTFQLTIAGTPAAPVITVQPTLALLPQPLAGIELNLGVTATGFPAPTYQWLKNGVPIPGAVSSSLHFLSLQFSDSGTYAVTVSNASGTVTSVDVVLAVQGPPAIAAQPASQTVAPGVSATFAITATGVPAPTYQWQKNNLPIANATAATLTLNNVQSVDAGNYSVVASNQWGSVTSSAATLTVSSSPPPNNVTVPTITQQPAAQSAFTGTNVSFTVSATGSPALTYQWYFNGAPISGATSSAYPLANVQPSNAGNYAVAVSNSAGSITSNPAALIVNASTFGGIYFGKLGADGSGGNFALYVRPDGTGVMLLSLSGSNSAIVLTNISLAPDGSFTANGNTLGLLAFDGAGSSRVSARSTEAASSTNVAGAVSPAGVLTGNVNGLSLSAGRSAGGSPFAGFYQAPAVNGGTGDIYTIVAADSRALVVAQSGTGADAGLGVVDGSGRLAVATAAGVNLSETLDPTTNAVTATADKGALSGLAFDGVRDDVTRTDRLADISTRGRAGLGDEVLIAGFIISGNSPRQVLVRAVGPTLADYGVSGVVADPVLALYSGSTKIAESDNWGVESAAATIAATATRLGAFNLPATSKDAVLLVTLDPGAYTAQVSGAGGTTGVALVEVYDAGDAPPTAVTPKLANISTRGRVGTDDQILIAGIVIGGNAPKRVLVRAVGPSLTPLGVNGALADPMLTILSGSTVISQNDDWGGDASVVAVANSIGAFALPSDSKDACLLITLAPGTYTAQVRGKNGSTGVAIVEVYDAPN
jgi:hypothetical protein